ncbi:thioredoxin domain-containing protein [Streptomyces sp. PTY087I2]|uniref:DsbA family protein n=1 Tax=Streptomyces sp. PTY087I2 TaxID=1819298 RepID=UPI0021004031|nr:thioredoxin domain-containing protein [Streptomyces sp. PTY087I2]
MDEARGGTPAPPAYAGVEELPEELAADGTTIVVGDPAAATTVRLYEDPRCPFVEEFEATGAPALREMTLLREVKTEYTLASFRDDRVGGDGSKRAVNALRAALDAGKFTEYHAVIFENMTVNELAGGYTTASLLKLADQVEGLRSETFDSAVTTMKYKDFVTASQKTYETAGGDDPRGPGTPRLSSTAPRSRGSGTTRSSTGSCSPESCTCTWNATSDRPDEFRPPPTCARRTSGDEAVLPSPSTSEEKAAPLRPITGPPVRAVRSRCCGTLGSRPGPRGPAT